MLLLYFSLRLLSRVGCLLALLLAAVGSGYAQPTIPVGVTYNYMSGTPPGLNAYLNYDEARAAAQRAGKPLLIEFTCHACINAYQSGKNNLARLCGVAFAAR